MSITCLAQVSITPMVEEISVGSNKWSLYTDKTAGETLYAKDGDIKGWATYRLKRTGIVIWEVQEGAACSGGILYWNGKKYIWLQQGE